MEKFIIMKEVSQDVICHVDSALQIVVQTDRTIEPDQYGKHGKIIVYPDDVDASPVHLAIGLILPEPKDSDRLGWTLVNDALNYYAQQEFSAEGCIYFP